MATKFIKLTGKVAWAKNLFTLDETPWGKFWSVDLYPDAASLKLMKEHKVGLRPVNKPFFEGEDGFRFRRPNVKTISGKEVVFERPTLLDVDNNNLNMPEGVYIGNGSIMELNVAVYQTRGGEGPVGHRLEGAKLLELVEYTGDKENDPVEGQTKTAVSPPVKKPW